MSLLVLCVRWGTKYSDAYVKRLQHGVTRYLSREHEFICLTSRPIEGVQCVPLPSALGGWWSKVGLFRPGIMEGEKLYLDLDVIVTGPLDVFLRPGSTKVWALDDFAYSLRCPRAPEEMDPETRALLGGVGTCNSSVMYWENDFGSDVWDKFDRNVTQRLHGDQNWITQALWPHTLELYPPGLACSYKYHVQLEGFGFGSLCVFHGEPKPHELEASNPLRQLWESQ